MTSRSFLSRRGLLRLAGVAAVGGLAGCSGDPDEEAAEPTSDEPTTADTTTRSDLDLSEATVVNVTIDGSGEEYDVAVAIHHDDGGEDGYANWWQVESQDGTRLGRRELGHPHSEQPFTRSTTVAVPDSVTCVVVRGHDQTHGYGGQLVVVDLTTGETRAIDQGTEPVAATADWCP